MGFFRLPAWLLMAIGVLALPFAGFMYVDMNADKAEAAEALRIGPPEIVNLSDFIMATNAGPADEVFIRAQADLSMRYELTRSKKGRVRDRAHMVPLYAINATDNSAEPIGLIWDDAEVFNYEAFLNSVVADGAIGPIVELNGVKAFMGSLGSNAKSAFEEQSRAYSKSSLILVVDPFFSGREAELTKSGDASSVAMLIGGVGLLIFLFGLFKYRRKKAAA